MLGLMTLGQGIESLGSFTNEVARAYTHNPMEGG